MAAQPQASEESLAVNEDARAERRHLTVLFCDLVGSTDLTARLDPEEYREALRAYHRRADEVITRYGGYVAQHLGDGLLVYFGWPQAFDDAAERSVRAALALVESTATVEAGGAPLAARVGLHTGGVVVSEVGTGERQETLALGETPNVAARVQAAAASGEVFITATTHRLVSGLFVVESRGEHVLKGLPQPVLLYRVLQSSGVRGRLAAAGSSGLTPFVDRVEERALLRSRFDLACDGEGQVVLLTGEAGIGKSRLAQVLREQLAGTPHTWLETGGAPYFTNTPFYALVELLKQFFYSDPEVGEDGLASGLAQALGRAGLNAQEALPLVAPLLNLPLPDGYQPVRGAPELTRKRLLATLASWVFGIARLQPLVILLEDLHWVDPSTLELQQLLVEQGATEPLLLLFTARPEFQPPWAMRAHHTHLTLNRLPRRYVRDMVRGAAARSTLLAEVIEAVVARTDGVPLFVEELTKAVIGVGTQAAAREIPDTLADSLMARLDRLGSEVKEVAQIGAVCGREFTFALLHGVHPVSADELEAALRQLVDAELLYARGLPPEVTYTFKHALIQDTAYEALLKSRRRVLHSRVAAVLIERFPNVAAEQPELLAEHHSAAAEYEAAVAALQSAGEKAIDRGAYSEAERYLGRGLDLLGNLPEGVQRDSTEFQLRLSLGKALVVTKGFASPEAAAAFDRAVQVGERLAEPEEFLVLLVALTMSALTRDGPASARGVADQTSGLLERMPQSPARALVRMAQGLVHYHAGEFARARQDQEEALKLAGEQSSFVTPIDPRGALRTHLAFTVWQLGFAEQALAHVQDAITLAAASGRCADRAWAEHQAASLYAQLGELAPALSHARDTLAICAEEPNPMDEAVARMIEGWALAELGQIDEGLAKLQAGFEAFTATGQRLGVEFYSCLLADVHARAGELDEALRILAEGEEVCPHQASPRSGTLIRRAEFMARNGAASEQVEAAYDDALAWTRRVGAKTFELRAVLSYARWLRNLGRADEAREHLAPVFASFTEGFNTRDLLEAAALLETLGDERGENALGAPIDTKVASAV